jgi:hypothetical protein
MATLIQSAGARMEVEHADLRSSMVMARELSRCAREAAMRVVELFGAEEMIRVDLPASSGCPVCRAPAAHDFDL